MKDELRATIQTGATALRLLHYPERATALDTVPAYIDTLEAVVAAAEAYIGPVPLELLTRRDAGEAAIGSAAEPAWIAFLEALRDAKAAMKA